MINDDSCLSTIGYDCSKCSVAENMILIERGDNFATKSSNIPTLTCGSLCDKSITWSDFVVNVNNYGSGKYARIYSEGSSPEVSVSVSESKILIELENGKAWLLFSEPQDRNFYLYQSPFSGTWGASIQ